MPRKPKQLTKDYKGELKSPITSETFPPYDLLCSTVDEEQHQKLKEKYMALESGRIMVAHIRKLFMLLDHYEVDQKSENKWYELALQLALNHVPGFRLEIKPVAKMTKWNPVSYAKLYFDVEGLLSSQRGKALSQTAACNILLKREPWNNFLNKTAHEQSNPAKTLQQAYMRSKSSGFVVFYNQALEDDSGRSSLLSNFPKIIDDMFKKVS